MKINDVETYPIEKTIKWINELTKLSSLWIFTDNQKSIKSINNLIENPDIYQILNNFQQNQIRAYIHWISGHFDIPNNEKANLITKSALASTVITSNRIVSFDFVENQIIQFNQNYWK